MKEFRVRLRFKAYRLRAFEIEAQMIANLRALMLEKPAESRWPGGIDRSCLARPGWPS